MKKYHHHQQQQQQQQGATDWRSEALGADQLPDIKGELDLARENFAAANAKAAAAKANMEALELAEKLVAEITERQKLVVNELAEIEKLKKRLAELRGGHVAAVGTNGSDGDGDDDDDDR